MLLVGPIIVSTHTHVAIITHTHTHIQVDDSCIPDHLHERRVKEVEDDEIASLVGCYMYISSSS